MVRFGWGGVAVLQMHPRGRRTTMATTVPSAAEMAASLETALQGLGFPYWRVYNVTRFSTAVEVSRYGNEEEYAEAQVRSGWALGPNVRTIVAISSPEGFPKAWDLGPLEVRLIVHDDEDRRELKAIGVALRRQGRLTHEKAFKKVVEFLQKNARKLQGT